jgi:hypothetical protein
MRKTEVHDLPELLTPILVTIPHAAAMIARGISFIYVAIGEGKIKAVKSDRRTLVRVDSLHEYVAKLPSAKIKPPARKCPPLREQQKSAFV